MMVSNEKISKSILAKQLPYQLAEVGIVNDI